MDLMARPQNTLAFEHSLLLVIEVHIHRKGFSIATVAPVVYLSGMIARRLVNGTSTQR